MTDSPRQRLNRPVVAVAAMLCIGVAMLAAPRAEAAPVSGACSDNVDLQQQVLPVPVPGTNDFPYCEFQVQCPAASACILQVSSLSKGTGIVEGRAQTGGSVRVCGYAPLECGVAYSVQIPAGQTVTQLCWTNGTGLNMSVSCTARMVPVQ